MKICIPTETDSGKQAKICQHFGSAPYFTIYDTDAETMEILENGNEHHVHGACNPLGALSGRNLDAVICIGMGPRAIQKLKEAGITTFITEAQTVDEVVQECEKGVLKEIDISQACKNHGCH